MKNNVGKPVYKKIWFWLVVVVAWFSLIALLDDEEKEPVVDKDNGQSEVVDTEESPEVVEADKEEEPKEEEPKKEEPKEEEKVPREFRNALGSARSYLDYMSFSKEGLYDQLLYEEYPEDAARYAVDTVDANWNENALETAKSYLEFSNFSDKGLYDQLIYEKYTPEQAQYAIDNLD